MSNAVLVVDDAATVRLYYRTVLAGIGCTVDEAWNGLEGLEHALRAPPDLMLVDVNMPHLDGYGFLRAVRREPELQAIPAVMISTEGAPADAAQAFAVGANMYVHKPVRPDHLAGLVRLLLGMKPA